MQVIRKINNNAAICVDSAGNEMIAIGTGIGFPPIPYELEDLDKIQRTYYDIDPSYLNLLNEIPSEIFEISSQIAEMFRNQVNDSVSSNLVFTLADHINFAIERHKKSIHFENPLQYEIQHLYEIEYEIGIEAIKIIQDKVDIRLPKAEVANIALHLINAEAVAPTTTKSNNFDSIIQDVVNIIGKNFQVYVDKDSFNYSRFVSHFQYLMKREQSSQQITSENYKLFQSVIEEYPKTYEVVLMIKDYLREEWNIELSDEELLYLVLHVNRLCVREDCNR